MWKNVKEVKPKQIEGKQTYLNIIKINFKSCSFVVRFFAFCGLTMCDIKTCNKINVVGLEILNILVYHKNFLGEIFFWRIFGCFFYYFSLFYQTFLLSYFLTFFLIIIISDWLKLLHESQEENAIYFVFLEMCKQKFEVTEFEFPAS